MKEATATIKLTNEKAPAAAAAVKLTNERSNGRGRPGGQAGE
jgi:hypothetical protein